MLALKDAQGRALRWVKTSLASYDLELRDKTDVFGAIRVPQFRDFSAAATAQTLAHRWEIWQTGVFLWARILLDPQRNANTATIFRPRFLGKRGGRLEGQERLSFDETSALRSRWDWRDEQKEPIVRLEGRVFLSGGCDAKIRADAYSRPDLDLLVVLGFYYKHRADSQS